MIFKQLFEPVSSTYTYLIGCEQTGQAVLVDPVLPTWQRDLEVIAELGLRLVYSLDTHVHADHITAARKLKAEAGSRIAHPAIDALPCTDLPLQEGTSDTLLATGSVAAQPPIEGADLPGVIGTEEAMELREIPARVAILGSKPWDIELAQSWCQMGSQVTLVERGRQLLPEADREIAQRLGKLLHDSGIAINRGIAVESIRQCES